MRSDKFMKILKKHFFIKVLLLFLATLLLDHDTKILGQDDTGKQAEEIREKYFTAIGGKSSLDEIKTVETTYLIESQDSIKKGKRIEDKSSKPTKYYTVLEDENKEKLETGFNGQKRWTRSRDYSGYDSSQGWINPDSRKYIKLANENIDGKEYLVIQQLSDSKAPAVTKLYYDLKTYLLARTTTTVNFMHRISKQIIFYEDYRQVDNILIPFSEIIERDGQIISRKTIISVKHNIEVSPDIFEYKKK